MKLSSKLSVGHVDGRLEAEGYEEMRFHVNQ